MKGGDGDDVFSLAADNVLIDGEASVKVDGGKGDDSASLTATNIGINGELKAKVDVETLTTAFEDPPATPGPDAKVDVDVGNLPRSFSPDNRLFRTSQGALARATSSVLAILQRPFVAFSPTAWADMMGGSVNKTASGGRIANPSHKPRRAHGAPMLRPQDPITPG